MMWVAVPVIWPLMRIASTPRYAALLARVAIERFPRLLANSGVMLLNMATDPAPICSRYAAIAPKSGCIIPRSLSKTPVNTSRTKDAPVARATARLDIGSQTRSMPNGRVIEVAHLTDDRRHRRLRPRDRRASGTAGPPRCRRGNASTPAACSDFEVALHGVDEVSHPGRAVVPGAAGHRREVEHRDDRLVHAEQATQQSHAGLRTSVRRVRPFSVGRSSDVSSAGDHHLDAGLLDALDLLGVGAAVGHDGRDLLDRHHGAHRDRAELRAVGDDDDPLGALESAADHVGVAIVELGDPTSRREPGGADHRGVGVVAANRLDGRRTDARQLVLANQPARDDHANIAGAEQARHRKRRRDHHEVLAHREQAREMLDRGADAEEHGAHSDGQLGRALGDDALLPRVVQGARIGAHFEGPDQVGGGASVGTAHEAVAFEAAQVAPDGHLGNLEVARQRADLDGLVLRDPLQHLQAPLDR